MNNTHIVETMESGLAANNNNGNAETALRPIPAIALPGRTPEARGGMAERWQTAIGACNDLHTFIAAKAATAQEAAKQHFFATLSLGCLLSRMISQAAADGVPIKALFADFKGDDATRDRALVISGGFGIGFTYATGNKYVKLFREHYRRICKERDAKAAAKIIADHAQALIAGAYADTAEALYAMWNPYATAGNLRQAWLELTPEKASANLATVLTQAEGNAQLETWEAKRVKLCQTFGGLFDNLDAYIIKSSMFVTPTDREDMACRLEQAAAKLRAQKTQPDIPGLIHQA